MKKSIFCFFIIVFSLTTQAQISDFIVSNGNDIDFALVDTDNTNVTTEAAAPILFQAGVTLTADKNTATIDLASIEKDPTSKYKFSLYTKDGDLAKEYRFIRLKASDKSMILDVNNLTPGEYMVEVSYDMPQVFASTPE